MCVPTCRCGAYRRRHHIEVLKLAGAAEVVAEVLEGSVMLAAQALLLSGVPFNKVLRRIRESRSRRYSMFNSFFSSPANAVGETTESLQPRFQSVLLNGRDAAVGKMLDEVNLAELEVQVNAVRRQNVSGNQPAGDMVLQAVMCLFCLASRGADDGGKAAARRVIRGQKTVVGRAVPPLIIDVGQSPTYITSVLCCQTPMHTR